jgi:hypothetical protein
MNDEMTITLTDGVKVTLRQFWSCGDNPWESPRNRIACTDNEGCLIDEWDGTLPDTDDEDFDLEKFTEEVEEKLNWL